MIRPAANDKVLHFAAGSLIAIVATALVVFFRPVSAPLPAFTYLGATLGLALAAFIGWGKERWDEAHPPHDASEEDFVATMAGAAWAGIWFALGTLLYATGWLW